LQRRAKAPTSAHRDRFRANIILLRLEGVKIENVAKQLKTSMPTVSESRGRRNPRKNQPRPRRLR
jgi:hypothetical protein